MRANPNHARRAVCADAPRRKRSRGVQLILMAPLNVTLGAAIGATLSGCGEPEVEALSFHDIPECVRFGADPDECQAALRAAEQQHKQSAPRYANQQECAVDFGAENCEAAPERHQGGSFFMPVMAGFLAGQMMGRSGLSGGNAPALAAGQTAGGTAAGGNTPIRPQPLYKSRDDRTNFRTADNRVIGPAGATRVRPSAVQPRPAQLVRSGGFGQQAAQRTPTRGFGG